MNKMDRFEYIEARLFEGESYLKRDKNVKIYDGDDKVILVVKQCQVVSFTETIQNDAKIF